MTIEEAVYDPPFVQDGVLYHGRLNKEKAQALRGCRVETPDGPGVVLKVGLILTEVLLVGSHRLTAVPCSAKVIPSRASQGGTPQAGKRLP